MKRLLPLLLLLCLLLTACSPANPPTEPSATTEPTTEAPTGTEGTTAPTEPQPPQLQVNADFSQYAPQTPAEAKYTRLSDSPLEALEPTDRPTRIFPFPGKVLVDEYGGLYITEDRFKYGIIDETGCILVDPIYSSVYLLSENNSREYLPYWILEKTTAEPFVWKDGSTYMDSETRCAFASIDGTFVSDCVYSTIAAYEDRILAFYPIEEDKPFGFDVYDLDHNFLFSSYDLSFSDKLGGGPYYYTYAEGLYTIVFESRTYAPEGYYSSEYTYYYMDEGGNIVLGPYYDASHFSHGKAAVRLAENSDYVFINKNGTVLSQEYESYEFLPNGNIIVPEKGNVNNHHDLLDENLEFINFLPGYYFVTEDGNIQVYDSFNNEYCYTPEGEQLWLRSNAHFISSILCEHDQGDGTVLENIQTGKTRKLPPDSYCDVIGDPADPIITIHYWEEPDNFSAPRRILYLNKDLEELDIATDSYEYMSCYEIGIPRFSALCLAENGRSTVYTVSAAPFATYPVKDCHMAFLYPGQFASLTTTECTYLYSPDGELLFAYPINPMDD